MTYIVTSPSATNIAPSYPLCQFKSIASPSRLHHQILYFMHVPLSRVVPPPELVCCFLLSVYSSFPCCIGVSSVALYSPYLALQLICSIFSVPTFTKPVSYNNQSSFPATNSIPTPVESVIVSQPCHKHHDGTCSVKN